MAGIRIGVRSSRLAAARAAAVVSELRAAGQQVEVVPVASPSAPAAPSAPKAGPCMFVTSLHDALRADQIDVAIQSYKDLSVADATGVVVAAVPRRADPRDALISHGHRALHELPVRSSVGVSARRRVVQLDAMELGLNPVPLGGSVDDITGRIAQVRSGDLDAVIVPRSAVDSLGLTDEIAQDLDPVVMTPSPAQGATACECRAGDLDIEHLLRATIHHDATAAHCEAERAAQAVFTQPSAPGQPNANSQPSGFAALATSTDAGTTLRGMVPSRVRGGVARASVTGTADTPPVQLGYGLAEELVDVGAIPSDAGLALVPSLLPDDC